MKKYAVLMQRDMQTEYTFMYLSDNYIDKDMENKIWIVSAEILNPTEGMDIDDMILRSPFGTDEMKYIGHYQFK